MPHVTSDARKAYLKAWQETRKKPCLDCGAPTLGARCRSCAAKYRWRTGSFGRRPLVRSVTAWPAKHGTRAAFTSGCRCDVCVTAMAKPAPTTKVCARCKQELPLAAFSTRSHPKYAYLTRPWCKACRAAAVHRQRVEVRVQERTRRGKWLSLPTAMSLEQEAILDSVERGDVVAAPVTLHAALEALA